MKTSLLRLFSSRHFTQPDLLFHRRYFHFPRCSTPRTYFSTMPSWEGYDIIEDVESLYQYAPGGYHPVHLGDQYYDRYRIISKLGHGGYSTTWLARDQKNNNKLVAVKIGTADSNRKEADILSTLNANSEDGTAIPGQRDSFFPPILDRFKIQGVNGTHPCYVTLPARASLSAVQNASYIGMFQLDVARALAAQLVLSVASLHSQGFAHGGMFKTAQDVIRVAA